MRIVIAALTALGARCTALGVRPTAEERTELDRLAARALGLEGAPLERILAWGRAHPPPESRAQQRVGPRAMERRHG